MTLRTNGSINPVVVLEGDAGVPAPAIGPNPGVYGSTQTVSISDADSSAAIYYTTNGTLPTTASSRYSSPLTVSSSKTISAVAYLGAAHSAVTPAAYTIVSAPVSEIETFSAGFADASNLKLNGSTSQVIGSQLQLVGGQDDSYYDFTSVFYTKLVNIESFNTDFAFQLKDPVAEGFTFTIQSGSDTKLGGGAQGLGYSGIGKSVAIKFDLVNDSGEGTNSTGIYLNGAVPTVPSVTLAGTGINLQSQDVFLAQISYDGSVLKLTLTDTATLATWSHSFTVDIPTVVGSKTAYVGFTASNNPQGYSIDLDQTLGQYLLYWTYAAGASRGSAPTPPLPLVPQYSAGFNPVGLQTNGNAAVSGPALRLTDGGLGEASSAFYRKSLNIQAFSTDFSFQLINLQAPLASLADGFTFTIQGDAPDAIGRSGSYLGYGSIGKSVAIKFDLHNNAGEGSDSTGIYLNGAAPTLPAIDLSSTGIDLHSGDPFTAHLAYDGTTLKLTLTDEITLATWSHSFAVDIPSAVGGPTAYAGFTAATGGSSAVQDILSWTFSNP